MRTREHPSGRVFVWLIVTGLFCGEGGAEVRYVDKTAPGPSHDGTSWATAWLTMQAAIDGAGGGDEIWVAAGTYEEHLQNRIVGETAVDIALFGGFPTGGGIWAQRDPAEHMTVLDGTGTGPVVTITGGAGPETRLDGFYIVHGHGIHGGGIKTVGAAPTIANNVIAFNTTDGAGGGISIWGFKPTAPAAAPLVTGNIIVNNRSLLDEGDGGGIAVIGSAPTIADNYLEWNEATRNGGAIACWRSSQPLIRNNVIVANSASIPLNESTDYGADTQGGGAIFASATDLDGRPLDNSVAAPKIYNNLIAANAGFRGGGICIINSIRTDLGIGKIINNTITSNQGAGVYWSNTTVTIDNNIIAYNTWGLHQVATGITGHTIRANCVYGHQLHGEDTDYVGLADLTGADGNISADPRLVDYRFGKLHVQGGSPCIDAGLLFSADPCWVDMDGQRRIEGKGVEIGADEFDGTTWDGSHRIVRVKPDGDDQLDGASWSSAKATVTGALAAVRDERGEVWVAEGTYVDHVELAAFVYLYGGFAGDESDRSEREAAGHPTILDGEGLPTVVKCLNGGYLVSALDGFTVQNGGVYTDGSPEGVVAVEGIGGGIYVRVSSPFLRNNTVQHNSLGTPYAAYFGRGGGVACYLSYAVISGNIIRENEVLSTDGLGGGLYVNLSGPWVEDNVITQNHCGRGAAIYGQVSTPQLRGNTITENQMYDTYPLPLYMGSVEGSVDLFLCPTFVLKNNDIRSNRAAVGAGFTLWSNDSGLICNNLITDNVAFDVSGQNGGIGGGIHVINLLNPTGRLIIRNNTLVGNTATSSIFGEQGGGIALQLLSDAITISNNILAYNSSGIWRDPYRPPLPTLKYNCMYNNSGNYIHVSPGIGDMANDPLLVNQAGGDYHLLPYSPCIDAGDPGYGGDPCEVDMDGEARVRYGRVDMGADEVYAIAGDFEPDEDVDLVDLTYWAGTLWAGCGSPDWCGGCDIDRSGGVDLRDFGYIAGHWMKGRQKD